MNFFEKLLNTDISPFLINFYESITIEMMVKFFIIYFFIIWIATFIWVIRDIWNRTTSILLQIFCILIILIWTPLGIFLYLLIRPGKTLFEKYYDEIEDNLDTFSWIIEEKTSKLWTKKQCPNCQLPVSPDFQFCPHCTTKLVENCIKCDKILSTNWVNCPYCGTKQEEKKEKNEKSKKSEGNKKTAK